MKRGYVDLSCLLEKRCWVERQPWRTLLGCQRAFDTPADQCASRPALESSRASYPSIGIASACALSVYKVRRGVLGGFQNNLANLESGYSRIYHSLC